VGQGLLYYFACQDTEEYTLLCGPISQDMYDVAVSELKSMYSDDYAAQSTMGLVIDRLACHATRVQIETLIADLRTVIQQIELVQDKNFALQQEIQQMQFLEGRPRSNSEHSLRSQVSLGPLFGDRIIDELAMIKLQAAIRGFNCRGKDVQLHGTSMNHESI